ncbi:MAG: LCP family protein [Lachnospiraceae bacterium]|nr:LCP family protein [Lachnospiraceae bacterium]
MKKDKQGSSYDGQENWTDDVGYYDGRSSGQEYDGQYYGDQGGQSYAGQNGQYYGSQDGQSYGGQNGQYYGSQDGQYYGGQGQDGPSYYGQGNYYDQQANFRGNSGQGGYGETPPPVRPDGAEDPDRRGKMKKKKKKKRKIFWVLGILVLLIAAVGIAGTALLGGLDREKLSNILVNSGVTSSGYRNIAIFGVDSREGELESGTRSDTIIIASINKSSGDIKLVSVYRDTYLDNTDGSYRKATEAYAYGGAALSVNMLNKNLDLDIEDYVTVDFEAVIEVVDELGGVEVTLDDEEVYWLNAYLVETSEVTGRSYTEVTSSGTQTLTGIQAMAYCRIRYTTGWDYKRTERQRTVLTQILKKAQEQGVTGLLAIVNNMIPYISTSLSNTELISLASGIAKYNIVDSQGFPFESTTATVSSADCVIPQTLATNVAELHELLYGTSYTVSSTVQEISDNISAATGVY